MEQIAEATDFQLAEIYTADPRSHTPHQNRESHHRVSKDEIWCKFKKAGWSEERIQKMWNDLYEPK